MNLTELLSPWLKVDLPSTEITDLQNDSRKISPGCLFFAYPGAETDGRLYLGDAQNADAAAALYEPNQWPSGLSLPEGLPCIAIPNLKQLSGAIAARFFGKPSKELAITGVTGTNGKTTIAYQLAAAHNLLATKSAYIGTLGQGAVGALQPLVNTTPEPLSLQHMLHEFKKDGVLQVSMEVSSHALAEHRVTDIDFQQAIFTNLTHDHLDYHHSMDEYAKAKSLLFGFDSLSWVIVNGDDPYAERMLAAAGSSKERLTYGFHDDCAVKVLDYQMSMTGSNIDLQSPWGRAQIHTKTMGFFNIYNTLAVFSSLLAYGYPMDQVVAVLADLNAAPGRMEIMSSKPLSIVDYAHTPDALLNVLKTLQHVKKGRIIVVFGCGGDRDKAKRPIMGEIAANHADLVIATSDNPRTEDPEDILKEVVAGIKDPTCDLHVIADRRLAIAKAIELAEPLDIILVAGKGHEAYQQIGKVRHAFSDQEVLSELIG